MIPCNEYKHRRYSYLRSSSLMITETLFPVLTRGVTPLSTVENLSQSSDVASSAMVTGIHSILEDCGRKVAS